MHKKQINLKESLGEGKHKCTVCKKGFACKSKLDAHLRSHTGERPHQCTTCDQKFKHKNHLNAHMRIHSGKKPYECSICSKRFTQNAHLKTHMLFHSREKPHQCPTCHKMFTLNGTLQRHLKIHLDEKGTLERHVKSIHLNKTPYYCDVCNKGFHLKNGLIKHLNDHWGEKLIFNKALASRAYLNRLDGIRSRKNQDTSEPKEHSEQNSDLHDGFIKQELEFEVPIIKKELISEEDLADEVTPSCSYQTLDMKQEPNESADPTGINLFEDLFIKEETK